MVNQKSKKIAKWLVITVAVLGLLTIGHLHMWAKFKAQMSMMPLKTTDTTPVHVVLGDREYLVPKNYFIFPYTEQNSREQTLLIRAYYPEMHGATRETIEFERKNFGWGGKLHISLNHSKNKINNDGWYKIYIKTVDDKRHYDYEYKGLRYGLHYFQNVPRKVNTYDSDIYVDDLKNTQLLIRCHPELSKNPHAKNPDCQQNFRRGQIFYHISYSRTLQPNWKIVQQKVDELLDTLSKNPDTTKEVIQ